MQLCIEHAGEAEQPHAWPTKPLATWCCTCWNGRAYYLSHSTNTRHGSSVSCSRTQITARNSTRQLKTKHAQKRADELNMCTCSTWPPTHRLLTYHMTYAAANISINHMNHWAYGGKHNTAEMAAVRATSLPSYWSSTLKP